jgi:ATP-binding cassette subfamily B protein
MQAFEAEAVTQKDSLETNFEATRFAVTTRATLGPAKLRRQFALVPQDLVIFSGSIAENIRFVRPEASLDQVRRPRPKRRLIASPRAAARRIDTSVGKRGVTLSVGQRQRLAIARAIVKKAPVLLLDKATSALDAESERLGRQALDRTADQRTTIAHRFATAQKADRIVVMKKLPHRRTGLHSDLTQGTGLYARFAALQFSRRLGEDGKAASPIVAQERA